MMVAFFIYTSHKIMKNPKYFWTIQLRTNLKLKKTKEKQSKTSQDAQKILNDHNENICCENIF